MLLEAHTEIGRKALLDLVQLVGGQQLRRQLRQRQRSALQGFKGSSAHQQLGWGRFRLNLVD